MRTRYRAPEDAEIRLTPRAQGIDSQLLVQTRLTKQIDCSKNPCLTAKYSCKFRGVSVPREELAVRLRARRHEIEQALTARITTLPATSTSDDPEYLEGLRSTIPVAFEYSLAVVGSGEEPPPPVPATCLTQARLAARHRVSLDAVLRGYVAGSALLDEYIIDGCDRDTLQVLLRSRAVALENLLSRVSNEYELERRARTASSEARALERVKKLLRGEPHAYPDLNYDLALNHIGLVARGVDCQGLIDEVARSVDCRSLVARVDSETVWAWLGRRNQIHVDEVQTASAPWRTRPISVGIGEPANGVAGWRQTHRQAQAALPVAIGGTTQMARYADVCLIASALQDNLLRSSLREIYIQPLLVGKDGGAVHLQTLRAYFAAHRNGKSTASVLGVSRQAVANRLRVVEERLGRPLPSCATALEVALRLNEAEA